MCIRDSDPPVAGEPTTMSVGPIAQTVGYACILFNTDGSCATYRICTSPSSVAYRITFESPSGEIIVVNLESEFTPVDPFPPAPDGGTSGEFMLTGEFTFPESGEWRYQSQSTRTNICGGNQVAVSPWTDFVVGEDANVPVADPVVGAMVAVVAGCGYAVRHYARRSTIGS